MADTQSVVSDVKLFIERLKKELPEKDSVRFLQITDRQYAAMKPLLGVKTKKEKFVDSRQTLLF